MRNIDPAKIMPSPKYLQGQLLLDSGQLTGSFFARTVILVCQHDAEGAFGLVLNRPTGSKVGEALVADLPEQLKELPLFLGGPVQPAAMSFLHTESFLPDANVMANLSVGHSLDELMDLGESFATDRKVKLFAGYSGWSPGQLEDEIKRKAWLTHPASLDTIFSTDPAALWSAIMRLKGWRQTLLAQLPDDPSLN